MHILRQFLPLMVLLGILASATEAAAQPRNNPTTIMGGPTSIPAELEDHDTEVGFLERLEAEHFVTLAGDYTSMFQVASAVMSGDAGAASGVFRLYGTWELVGRGTRDRGMIVTKVEYRHAYGGTVPAELARNVGYVGVNTISFTDVGAFVAPLYWQQLFADASMGFVVGRIDPLDFVDVLGVGSQWTAFQNGATLANLTLPLPDVGCGAGVGKTYNDQWITAVTVHDLSGSQTSMACFPNGLELYKEAYLGWSPSRAGRFGQAVLLTVWHAGARSNGQGSGRGVAVSANWTVRERWMPFVRAGLSGGETAVMKSQLSTGVTYTFGQHRSQTGAAISFQKPTSDTLGGQTTFETYLRWQMAPDLALSPNVQFLVHPALNPERTTITLVGVRLRYVP